jgi:NAD(P)-dependent dehydrogenase (short-subunit alcohol dehydrogenase family)
MARTSFTRGKAMNLDKPFDFTGQVAVVTGGSGVLGGALARALGQQGAAVVVVGHTHLEKAEAVAESIVTTGGQAVAMEGNVLDKASLETLAQRVLGRYGHVDILLNAAGGTRKEATTGPQLSFFDLPEEAVRWVFDLNFLGTFFACQVFGRIMVQQGHGNILNIASMGALKPLTRGVANSAAKAGVVNLTQWLAVYMSQEYSARIRVNALVPGYFLTEQNRFLLFDQQSGDLTTRGQRIIDHTPMGRLGQPEDLVGPALLLLADVAGFVHGTTLVVDGGVAAYGGV